MTRIWVAMDKVGIVELFRDRPVFEDGEWDPCNDDNWIGGFTVKGWPGPTPNLGEALCVEMTVVDKITGKQEESK